MILFDLPQNAGTGRLCVASPDGDCTLIYRLPTVDDIEADQWRAALVAKSDDRGAAMADLYRARRAAVFRDWEGIEGPDGRQLAFSQTGLLTLIIRVPAVELAVTDLLGKLFSLERHAGEPKPPRADGTLAAGSPGSGPNDSPDSSSEPVGPGLPNSSG